MIRRFTREGNDDETGRLSYPLLAVAKLAVASINNGPLDIDLVGCPSDRDRPDDATSGKREGRDGETPMYAKAKP